MNHDEPSEAGCLDFSTPQLIRVSRRRAEANAQGHHCVASLFAKRSSRPPRPPPSPSTLSLSPSLSHTHAPSTSSSLNRPSLTSALFHPHCPLFSKTHPRSSNPPQPALQLRLRGAPRRHERRVLPGTPPHHVQSGADRRAALSPAPSSSQPLRRCRHGAHGDASSNARPLQGDDPETQKRPPVFLQHGLMQSSEVWVCADVRRLASPRLPRAAQAAHAACTRSPTVHPPLGLRHPLGPACVSPRGPGLRCLAGQCPRQQVQLPPQKVQAHGRRGWSRLSSSSSIRVTHRAGPRCAGRQRHAWPHNC